MTGIIAYYRDIRIFVYSYYRILVYCCIYGCVFNGDYRYRGYIGVEGLGVWGLGLRVQGPETRFEVLWCLDHCPLIHENYQIVPYGCCS